MLVAGLYIAATVAVTVYMLVALLRPEDFDRT
jgi:K+-transporting ATPase KdpF subunit